MMWVGAGRDEGGVVTEFGILEDHRGGHDVKRIVLITAGLLLASCGSSGGGAVPKASPTSGETTTTSATAGSTRAESTSTQSAAPSGIGDKTCANQDPSTAVPPIRKLANPKTAVHASYRFTVDYPPAWYDGTDQATVSAGGVLDDTTLGEAGVNSADTLMNMNVEDKTNYPGLTVYRFQNVNDTPDAVAARMAKVLQTRGAQTSPRQSWCLDGVPARGFLALSSSGTLQESWFAFHGGALYYAFFLGKSDGTQATQDGLVVDFTSILATWKWS